MKPAYKKGNEIFRLDFGLEHIELEIGENGHYKLQVKVDPIPIADGKDVQITLTEKELQAFRTMLNEGTAWRNDKMAKAKEQAKLLLTVNPPITNVSNYIKEVHQTDSIQAGFLFIHLIELLFSEIPVNVSKEEKLQWFEMLTEINTRFAYILNMFEIEGKYRKPLQEWGYTLKNIEDELPSLHTEKTKVMKKKKQFSKDHFGEDVETELDYWERVAKDSGMSLEEYFNSMD